MSDRNKEEEIDLIEFLRLVKRNVISFLNSIIDAIGLFFFFIKKNVLLFVIATFLSGLLGWLSYFIVPKPYVYKVIIACNDDYVDILYRKIDYLNELLNNNIASEKLEEIGVPKENIDIVKEFKIEPVKNKYEVNKLYNTYLKENSGDSLVSLYSKDEFKEQLSEYSFPKHEICLLTYDNKGFSNVLSSLLNSTLETKSINDNLKGKRAIKQEKLNLIVSSLKTTEGRLEMIEEDLHSIYETSAKLDLLNNYTVLLIEKMQLDNKLIIIQSELAGLKHIYTVIDDYSTLGYKYSDGRVFYSIIIANLFLLLFLILRSLNKFFILRVKY